MTLYDKLGLTREASEAQVRRAYRRLARRWHPDLNPGNTEAAAHYAAITDAYETLVDPARRRAYDASGPAPATVAPTPTAFAGFDFSLSVQGAQASTFGDLFVDVFRQAAGGADLAPARGSDLHVEVALSLAEVLRGTTRQIELQQRVPCRTCRGGGVVDAPAAPCQACQGRGQQRLGRGHMVFVRQCETCLGSGVVRQRACPGCHGHGQQDVRHVGTVTLPAGLSDGDEIVQHGHGHVGRRGGPPGDLRIRIRVAPDARLTRLGNDLHLALPVAIHEAVLGTRVAVPTPDGEVTVRVPPGVQSGQRLRLRERGVPSRRTGRRGDLVLEVQLVLPPVIDARGRTLMQEFARLHPEDVRAGWQSSSGTVRPEDGLTVVGAATIETEATSTQAPERAPIRMKAE